MKTIKYIFLSIISISFLSSCDKGGDPVNFDGQNGQTLVSFESSNADLAILVDGEGTLELPINITTKSSSERTFTVQVNEESTTADPNSYSFGNITIPANEYNGTLTINGTDVNVETSAERLTLDIVDTNDIVTTSNSSININVFQICPVSDTSFVGNYLIEQTTPFVDGPTLSDGSIVELTGSGTSRTFMTANYPSFCGTLRPFNINLVCNEIIVPIQNSGCSCNDGTGWFTAATTPGTFDANDDTTFTVTFTDDTNSDCGAPVQTSYRFTKQ